MLNHSSWKVWSIGLVGAAFAVGGLLPATAGAVTQDRSGGVELLLEADIEGATETGPSANISRARPAGETTMLS